MVASAVVCINASPEVKKAVKSVSSVTLTFAGFKNAEYSSYFTKLWSTPYILLTAWAASFVPFVFKRYLILLRILLHTSKVIS